MTVKLARVPFSVTFMKEFTPQLESTIQIARIINLSCERKADVCPLRRPASWGLTPGASLFAIPPWFRSGPSPSSTARATTPCASPATTACSSDRDGAECQAVGVECNRLEESEHVRSPGARPEIYGLCDKAPVCEKESRERVHERETTRTCMDAHTVTHTKC
jgi:hypothetical protein